MAEINGSGVLTATLKGSGGVTGDITVGKLDDSKVKSYDSVFEFPNRGLEYVIYLDKSENAVYRWDEVNSKYYCVGRDYKEIEDIYGGNL